MIAYRDGIQVERWETLEVELTGPGEGNPFVDVELSAVVWHGGRRLRVPGFYDGGGRYRLRLLADTPGPWSFTTTSNVAELDGAGGSYEVIEPSSPTIHGPVVVRDGESFMYADGHPYLPVGTTCYGWIHQSDELIDQTLATLRTAPFNKLRMLVLPKHFEYNRNEPRTYPFEQDEAGKWDFARFNPDFFQHLDRCVEQLGDLGIEADVILLHPYDRWGFSQMPAETDDRYLRYVVARLAGRDHRPVADDHHADRRHASRSVRGQAPRPAPYRGAVRAGGVAVRRITSSETATSLPVIRTGTS